MHNEQSLKYFIDGIRYNCPFCKINCVEYNVEDKGSFFWDNKNFAYFYIIECNTCAKTSLHFSYYNIGINGKNFHFKPMQDIPRVKSTELFISTPKRWSPIKDAKSSEIITEYDRLFFYHRPPSGFTIDTRIPTKIRELIGEAEGCAKSGYLTAATACMRKAIYKLLKENGIKEHDVLGKLSYDKRLDLLQSKWTNVESYLIDTLKNIKFISDEELHENSWPDISIEDINLLKEVLIDIFVEIYITPDEQKKDREKIQTLNEAAKRK